MKIETIIKESFTVIGKEGSTADGPGFIQALWQDANGHFDQVDALAKRDKQGNLVGIWGAMSDPSRSFQPWADGFSRGLYLAGVECRDDAEAPEGWIKWIVPGYEFLQVENESPESFGEMIRYMEENHIPLAGAVHDFSDPRTGKGYMFFPIRKL
ncbi:MAG: GyrI-like domain-containing protein [Firmicutes bacterium]|nr:GyrI-like domain-containing protein [Bacillota bacterium]